MHQIAAIMLNRGVIIPLFLARSRSFLRNRGCSSSSYSAPPLPPSPLMAVNSTLSPAIFAGCSHRSDANERCLIQNNRVSFDTGCDLGRLGLRNGLSMRNLMRDQIQKSCAMARYKQSINESELFLVKNPDVKNSVNGSGECGNGKPLGFPGKLNQEKLVVAVDVDEGLLLV